MKLPSLFPIAFFAGGIFLSIELKNVALLSPRIIVFAALLFLLIGYIALRQNWVLAAALFAAGAWLSLGMAASNLERVSVPANLASTLIESGKLDASTALRWRGRLRGDPLQLPWGTRYEINLDEVESSAGVTPVAGGLRLTYYSAESASALPPPARAGDRIEALVRARPVYDYGDPGSFDFRGYLARQNIQLQGSLRNGQLLTIVGHPRLALSDRFARVRGRFLSSLNELFASRPDEGALARAMLLGDRSFVERDRVVDYQKTGVYHVMVLAGLHVGALAAFFLWAGRRLRLGLLPRILLTLLALAAYASIVEDRPPILRAVLMAAVFLCAKLIYRRMDLINVAAISALLILAARPSELIDASFLLVIFRGGHDRSDRGALHRSLERALPARAQPALRCNSRCVTRATTDSIPHRNARGGELDFRAIAAHCRAARIRPARASVSSGPLFLGDRFHFRNPSAGNASSARLLFSSRHADRTFR